MQTIVGVLRGGPSREHDVSLKTGHAILENLPADRFLARDLYIDRAGLWHDRGRPTTPDRALRSVDVALIGLHGDYGEDGQVQRLLERYGIPYAGADPFGSFFAMQKLLAKEKAREIGIKTPEYRFIQAGDFSEKIIAEVIRSMSQPVVVKPVAWGSTLGVSVVGGYAPVYGAVTNLLEQGASGVLIEERIVGREASVGVVEHFRDQELYALPPIEVFLPEDGLFSYDAKYSTPTREVCPAQFPKKTSDELMRAAKGLHAALGLRDYSRSDFIVSPKGLYYLETNTLPGLTSNSLFPKSLAAIGTSFSDFLGHLVDLALAR